MFQLTIVNKQNTKLTLQNRVCYLAELCSLLPCRTVSGKSISQNWPSTMFTVQLVNALIQKMYTKANTSTCCKNAATIWFIFHDFPGPRPDPMTL